MPQDCREIIKLQKKDLGRQEGLQIYLSPLRHSTFFMVDLFSSRVHFSLQRMKIAHELESDYRKGGRKDESVLKAYSIDVKVFFYERTNPIKTLKPLRCKCQNLKI